MFKNMLCSNNSGKEVGFVDFSKPNTNISIIFYYTQSVDVCLVEKKSHFQLAKMPKLNIVKHLRTST